MRSAHFKARRSDYLVESAVRFKHRLVRKGKGAGGVIHRGQID